MDNLVHLASTKKNWIKCKVAYTGSYQTLMRLKEQDFSVVKEQCQIQTQKEGLEDLNNKSQQKLIAR